MFHQPVRIDHGGIRVAGHLVQALQSRRTEQQGQCLRAEQYVVGSRILGNAHHGLRAGQVLHAEQSAVLGSLLGKVPVGQQINVVYGLIVAQLTDGHLRVFQPFAC